jgi:glycosyltransferase involved in cell wall biosynthesis
MEICRVFATFQVDLWYSEHYLAKELHAHGHRTTFISSDRYLNSWKPFLKTREEIGKFSHPYFNVERYQVWFPLEKTIWINWCKLYKRLFRSEFDVIHLLGIGTFSTAIVLLLSKFAGVKCPRIVISDHSDKRAHARNGLPAQAYYTFFNYWFKIFGAKTYAVIAPLPEIKTLLSKRFDISEDRIEFLPVGYDASIYNYRPSLKNREDKMWIGFAGKLGPSKQLDKLIRCIAAAGIADHVELCVAGKTKENSDYTVQLNEEARKYNISLTFLPFLNNHELAEFYNSIDLAVFPGGISITTIEASGCGLPVIIYKSLDNLESRVCDGRGHLFETESELINLLKKYLDMYKAGFNHEYIAQKTNEIASWKEIASSYLNIYTRENGQN